MNAPYLFTSESVTAGHPDKLCDQISDAVVDAYLANDPAARVISEAAVSGGVLFLAARANTNLSLDLAEIARAVIAGAGYSEGAFNARDCTVMLSQYSLSDERAPRLLVADMDDAALDSVAASQPASLFGYACDQTPARMPLPISLAHALARALDLGIAQGRLPGLDPDAKVQVGVEYVDNRPQRLHSVTLLTAQCAADRPSPLQLREMLLHEVLPALDGQPLQADAETRIHVNPEGVLVGGGPMLHAGLTGRKNAIDTYGEFARHSGAALSGKDPLRIDRVGAYAARHAAVQVVAAGLAPRCEVQLSYVVGQARPASLQVQTGGSGIVDDAELGHRLLETLDFRPAAIVRRFDLQNPQLHRDGLFRRLAVFGQMGRSDMDLPWDRADAVQSIA
jgi:S-adenosylmethionine synthetase